MSVCRTVTYVMPLASAREEKKRTSKCGTLWSFILFGFPSFPKVTCGDAVPAPLSGHSATLVTDTGGADTMVVLGGSQNDGYNSHQFVHVRI